MFFIFRNFLVQFQLKPIGCLNLPTTFSGKESPATMLFACASNVFIVSAVFRDACANTTHLTLQVERIQNPRLYKQYMIQREDVKRHLTSSNPVERELFHGTSPDDAVKICEQGFDRGFAGKNGRIALKLNELEQ